MPTPSSTQIKANQAFIRDAPRNRWLLYENPRSVISTFRTEDLLEKLQFVENAVKKNHWHAVGFVSYEAAPAFDPALTAKRDENFPLLWFGLYPEGKEIDLNSFGNDSPPPDLSWKPTVTPDEYHRAIQRIKNEIEAGQTYQVNYTYRLRSPFDGDARQLFRQLIAAQNPSYGAYLDTGPWVVLSASPELFFKLSNHEVESHPMKGTAKRGLTTEDDLQNSNGLHNSEKERAEHVMIVDMVRSDLGRIAGWGTVDVEESFHIEKYPTLWQMTSKVKATTIAGLTEIFRALFPPASITGAPKSSTMKLINDLESSPRRLYTGAIGYFIPGEEAQFNVAIRTVLIDRKNRQAEYGVGGGIVWDSKPQMELEECRTKSHILFKPVEEFSIVESILWKPGSGYHLLDKHLKRLQQSAQYFSYPMNMKEVGRYLMKLAEGLYLFPTKIRLLLAREGRITSETERLDKLIRRGSRKVCLAKTPVDSSDPFLRHKTTHRKVYTERKEACPGFDDVLLWNERGEITESTIANIIVQIGNSLVTPPVESGLLPGCQREWLIETGLVKEKVLGIEDLLNSPRVLLINSVRGLYNIEFAESHSTPPAAPISRQKIIS